MNFTLLMLILLVITGIIQLLDICCYRKKRAEGHADPLWLTHTKGFFPIILAVFLIRSFLAEPFKIPSGSMIPTLEIGDFILVNKFQYGLRVPLNNRVFWAVSSPKRGDVVVFHYPQDPSVDYIKRVVGLPGDHIAYHNKTLSINNVVIDTQKLPDNYAYPIPNQGTIMAGRFRENMRGVQHDILLFDEAPAIDGDFTVPEGHYFMMGDNRDNSNDSRYWGYVSENDLVGKAFLIWMNFTQPRRIGSAIY